MQINIKRVILPFAHTLIVYYYRDNKNYCSLLKLITDSFKETRLMIEK